ncbi:astacin (Peptidase family m12A) domain-containing protein [Ditylenchus destructor]|uniref:Metalloendopeptidase n=1 Tax=Ditylenchus destructor TaxID=166010 RepID=A0AAD4N8E3_9BILA|nr:astacin (Peptidase family m12A) domain-containing protein [Ditylenchus destructor]
MRRTCQRAKFLCAFAKSAIVVLLLFSSPMCVQQEDPDCPAKSLIETLNDTRSKRSVEQQPNDNSAVNSEMNEPVITEPPKDLKLEEDEQAREQNEIVEILKNTPESSWIEVGVAKLEEDQQIIITTSSGKMKKLTHVVTPLDSSGLDDDPALYRRRKKRAVVGEDKKIWNVYKSGDNYVIPYTIVSNYSESQVQKIRRAMKAIEERTCIEFDHIDTEDKAKFYRGRSYAEISNSPNDGCHSVIGRNDGKNQVKLEINSYSKILKRVTSLLSLSHELLHLLGLYHEHQRPDRDQFMAMVMKNVENGRGYNYDIKKDSRNIMTLIKNKEKALKMSLQDLPNRSRLGDVDKSSIMMYKANTFGKDGAVVIRMRNKGYQNRIGRSKHGSNLDYLKINLLYNCPGVNQMLAAYNGKSDNDHSLQSAETMNEADSDNHRGADAYDDHASVERKHENEEDDDGEIKKKKIRQNNNRKGHHKKKVHHKKKFGARNKKRKGRRNGNKNILTTVHSCEPNLGQKPEENNQIGEPKKVENHKKRRKHRKPRRFARRKVTTQAQRRKTGKVHKKKLGATKPNQEGDCPPGFHKRKEQNAAMQGGSDDQMESNEHKNHPVHKNHHQNGNFLEKPRRKRRRRGRNRKRRRSRKRRPKNNLVHKNHQQNQKNGHGLHANGNHNDGTVAVRLITGDSVQGRSKQGSENQNQMNQNEERSVSSEAETNTVRKNGEIPMAKEKYENSENSHTDIRQNIDQHFVDRNGDKEHKHGAGNEPYDPQTPNRNTKAKTSRSHFGETQDGESRTRPEQTAPGNQPVNPTAPETKPEKSHDSAPKTSQNQPQNNQTTENDQQRAEPPKDEAGSKDQTKTDSDKPKNQEKHSFLKKAVNAVKPKKSKQPDNGTPPPGGLPGDVPMASTKNVVPP